MAPNSTEYAQGLCKEFEALAGQRQNFESHWQEIAERIDPARSKLFTSFGSNQSQGEKRTELIFDATASKAWKKFAAILDSLLTPRNQTWHMIKPSDPLLQKNRAAVMYFEEVNRILYRQRYMPSANFAGQNHKLYLSLGAYGTGSMYVDSLRDRRGKEIGLRYKNIHLGQIYLAENHQGIIDTAFRRFNMKARQLLQKWPDKIPDTVKDKAKNSPEHEFEVLHAVKPNDKYDPERMDASSRMWTSDYILKEGHVVLEKGGYNTFPYPSSRYEQAEEEVYGRSPAMDALPAIKTLNEQKKTMLKQGHRVVDPVMFTHDDGVLDGFSMKPGALNVGGVTADGRPLIHTLPVGNLAVGKDLMDDERADINDTFLITLFQILQETPEMTATEVMERAREKGILMNPTVGRQETEYLGPKIERELDILDQIGALPKMPKILLDAQGEYQITYDSPLARTARAEEASGVLRTLETAINIATQTQNPAPLDYFDFDAIIPELATIGNVPARWIKSKEQVMKIREGRAQAMQQQQDIQAAPAAAAMIKADAVARKTKG